jgi:hypothetical protein
MLPIGRGRGELWNGSKFLCEVEYDISPLLPFISDAKLQRVEMIVRNNACEDLVRIPGITLVLADGSRHRLPKPVDHRHGDGHLECYLTTDIADTSLDMTSDMS